MERTAFLEKLGVLILPGFLRPSECTELSAEMRRAPQAEAPLSIRGQTQEVTDARQRSTRRAQVSQETSAGMVKRLLAAKPRVEAFFSRRLADIVEAPKFLVYRPGDFFIPHRDVRGPEVDISHPVIKARRLNLIVLLNAQAETPAAGEYSGAALTVYGLIDEPRWRDYGFPVPAVPGSLVVFRADIIHEVAPVIEGERYTVVSRMLDPDFQSPTA